MSKIPDCIYVNGDYWDILHQEKKPSWMPKINDPDGRDFLGFCDTAINKIWIKKTSNTTKDYTVLCHELLHTIFPKEYNDIELEEFLVNRMERKLYHLLRDNDFDFLRE